jgi:hypothetical protein
MYTIAMNCLKQESQDSITLTRSKFFDEAQTRAKSTEASRCGIADRRHRRPGFGQTSLQLLHVVIF